MSREGKVRDLATIITTDMFISMLNPKFRGKNFSFKSFDIEQWVDAMIGTNVNFTLTKQHRKIASAQARMMWNRWIKTIGDGLPC